MKINLHIERVVLDGVPLHRRDAPTLQRALEAELVRQLQQDKALPARLSGGAVPEIRADALHVGNVTTPAQWGQGIASAILGGFGK